MVVQSSFFSKILVKLDEFPQAKMFSISYSHCGLDTMLTTKRSAGVTPEMNLRERVTMYASAKYK